MHPSDQIKKTINEGTSMMVNNIEEEQLLLSHLKPDMRVLEFGLGISTLTIAPLVKELISIEHQRKYHDEFNGKLPPNVTAYYIEKNREPSANYDDGTFKDFENYVTFPLTFIDSISWQGDLANTGKFDVIYIDGRARVACAEYAAKYYLKPGGLIFIHDYKHPNEKYRRREYEVVEQFLELKAHVFAMGLFTVREQPQQAPPDPVTYDKTTCWYNGYVIEEMNRFYDNHIKDHNILKHMQPFTELLKQVTGGGKLLDLGCGTSMLAQFCTEFEYCGSDLAHIVAGCAIRNNPKYNYRPCDMVEDSLQWITKENFKVVVVNGVIDIMQEPLKTLRKILEATPQYLIIHRQEITEAGQTHVIKNGSYGGETYHSIINRKEFTDFINACAFTIEKETKCTFENWENGGSSFLLKRKKIEMKYFNNTLKQLRNTIINSSVKKIVIGAGDVYYGPEWIATNVEDLDITNPQDWQFFFGDTQADCIFAEHVFEHLTPKETMDALTNIFNYLKKGGNLRIAVPDGLFPNEDYINHVKPNGIGAGSDDHKILYTYKTLSDVLHQVPFMVELREYWNEQGYFVETYWNVQKGQVSRSRRFDSRNQGDKINYTSIIVDCIK